MPENIDNTLLIYMMTLGERGLINDPRFFRRWCNGCGGDGATSTNVFPIDG